MTTDTSQLLFWATSDPDAQGLAQSLQDLATDHRRAALGQLCQDPAAARAALKDMSEAVLCVIYTAPEYHVGRAIEQGEIGTPDLDDAAERWEKEARAALDLHHQNRKQCLLFESNHLRRFSETALSRLQLASERQGTLAEQTVWDSPDAPMLALMAKAHLRNLPALSALNDEIAASAQLLSNTDALSATLPVEEALTAFRAQRLRTAETETQHNDALRRLEEELSEKIKGLEALEAKIGVAEAEKATQAAEIASLQLKLSENRGARDVLTQQNKLILTELRDMALENARLMQDIQERTKALNTETEEKARILNERDAEVGGLHAEIDRIMSSRSMRLTAPLRRLGRLLGKKPNV